MKPTINEYKEKNQTSKTEVPDLKPQDEDEIYEKVMLEIEEDKKVKATWGKAFAQSGGDEAKATALYIQMRVDIIKKNKNQKDKYTELNHEKILQTREIIQKHFHQLKFLNFSAMKEYLIDFHSKYGYFASINDDESLFLRHKIYKNTFIILEYPKKLHFHDIKYFDELEPMSFYRE